MTRLPKTTYKKFRKWKILDSYGTDKFPIKYSDGIIGGAFQSHVCLCSGDIHGRKSFREVEAENTHFAVETMFQHRDEKCMSVVFDNEDEAKEFFDLSVEEAKANIPAKGNHW